MIGLTKYRLDALMTAEELGEATELNPRTIRRVEAGQGASIETLRKLSTFFSANGEPVRPTDLLRVIPDMPTTTRRKAA